MKYKKAIIIAMVLVGILALVIYKYDSGHTDDDGHRQVQIEGHDEHENEHEDEYEDEHEDEHEEGQVIELSIEQIKEIGIELATATGGKIDVYVNLPGEVAVNADRMAHIVPNAAGVVRRVLKNVGDTVKADEVLAWLESSEIGKAKVDYLTKLAEVGCCSMDLTRTKLVHDSTMKLLETLLSAPSVESLNQISGAALDKNHTTLISSYAELVLAKSTYQREKSLFEQDISSKQDYLAAENDFKKAEAKYAALRDSITFELQKNLIDAQRDQQVRLIGLKSAERSLYILGLTAEDINDVSLLGQSRTTASVQAEVCTDPNCTECAVPSSKGDKPALAKSSDENEKLAWHPLRAPFDGTVIDKHITLGEVVGDDADVFVIADLSSVWVDLHVYPKDLMKIKKGQKVIISAGQMIPDAEGVISYVGPVVGIASRTALARVVLPNSTGIFRPGLFVTAKVAIDNVEANVTVPKDAVQTLDGKKCVFIKDEHGFEPAFVNLGQSNTGLVQVTSGLDPGRQYVTKGAFELKAIIVTSTLDSHAGHGH